MKAGDSLSRIATRTLRPGVSLDQMLVSLYRGNPQAFMDNNMNRLKSGVVLAVPSAESAQGVTTTEARQVIQAQSADFGAYRQRLASGVPAALTEGSARRASGKVEASVNDRQQGATPTPDKLTLSKGAASAKAEEKISKDKAKKADDVRVAELSKNVDELKKIAGAAASAAAPKPASGGGGRTGAAVADARARADAAPRRWRLLRAGPRSCASPAPPASAVAASVPASLRPPPGASIRGCACSRIRTGGCCRVGARGAQASGQRRAQTCASTGRRAQRARLAAR